MSERRISVRERTTSGLLIVFTVLSIVAATSCRERGAEHKPIRVGTIRVLSGLPLYVAIDNKLFEKHGFAPVLKEFRTSDLVVKALENGEIDMIGCAGTSQVLSLARKKPDAQRLIGILYSSTCIITSATKPPLPSLLDLRGTTVACFPGSTFKTYTKEVLAAAGVDVSTVQIVPTPAELQSQSLREGKAQAVYTLEPTCAVAVQDGVAQYLTRDDLFATHFLSGRKFPGGAVTVSRQFVAKTPNAEQRLANVFTDSMAAINKPGFNIAPHLSAHTAIHPKFMPALTYEGAAFGARVDRGGLQALVDRLVQWQVLPRDFALQALF
jgi:NitT/TauT family transport system substrate-binding protein